MNLFMNYIEPQRAAASLKEIVKPINAPILQEP
jgi:hypothetical protein